MLFTPRLQRSECRTEREIEAAAEAVLAAVGADGTYEGVSADILPGWDLTSYEQFPVEPSPWGQGAALRALVALASAKGTNAER